MADNLVIEMQVGGAQNAVNQLSRVAQAAGQMGNGAGVSGVTPPEQARAQSDFEKWLSNAARVSQVARGLEEAFRLLAHALEAVTQNVLDFAHLQGALASTTSETAGLRLLGRALGFDPLSASQGIRSRMFSDPLAMAAANRLNLPIQPFDINQPQDLGRLMLNTLRGLREEFRRDPNQAMADTRNLGLGQLSFIIQAQRDLVPDLEKYYALEKNLYSPDKQEAIARLNIEWEGLKLQVLDLGTTIAENVIPAISLMIAVLEDWAKNPFSLNPVRAGFDWMMKHQAATEANTKELRANTDATMALRDGIYGGGPNARGAIPGAFQGGLGAGWDSLKDSTNRLGAFGLGS